MTTAIPQLSTPSGLWSSELFRKLSRLSSWDTEIARTGRAILEEQQFKSSLRMWPQAEKKESTVLSFWNLLSGPATSNVRLGLPFGPPNSRQYTKGEYEIQGMDVCGA